MEARWADYGSREGWEKRARQIRQGILEGANLEALRDRPVPQVIRHSREAMDGYFVENVAIESAPEFFVCGNLYLPSAERRMPVVLSAHGHGPVDGGRFSESVQIRCAALARMGCAVFAWDMVGYGESATVGWSHGKDPAILRLQLWNSVRVLDFMLGLPDADPSRVAVTGESGGATQAFLLAAVDERVTASIPCVQVSAWFYGGCACESGLPIHVRPGHIANNAEIAAVMAPKPMLILSDGQDWTEHVPELEFPYLQRIYGLFGRREAVENAHFADEGHDFGPSKRRALYGFIGKIFRLEVERADEGRVRVLPPPKLRAFNDDHPRPANEVAANQEIPLKMAPNSKKR